MDHARLRLSFEVHAELHRSPTLRQPNHSSACKSDYRPQSASRPRDGSVGLNAVSQAEAAGSRYARTMCTVHTAVQHLKSKSQSWPGSIALMMLLSR
jgi:hypothetical protein